MICFPHAKINLGLNVFNKREDGYHTIETVFYPVPFTDILEVISTGKSTTSKGRIEFFSEGIPVQGDRNDNLVMRAYHAVNHYFDLPSLKCYLFKSIPTGAGLGGGSSDAAFMIRLLNDRFELGMSKERMHELAAGIGSDCPFFIENKPAYTLGRGTELEPIDIDLKGHHIVILHPGIGSGTAEAYQHVTKRDLNIEQPSLRSILSTPVEQWKDSLLNDFEQSVFRQIPLCGQFKEQLYDAGALYASMSGSGSAVFGIFKQTPTLPQALSQHLKFSGAL